MSSVQTTLRASCAAAVIALFGGVAPGSALERVDFDTRAASKDLRASLEASSLLSRVAAEGGADGAELLAAARADYARLTAALYEAGFYAGEIHILLDGREAAEIAPLDAPKNFAKALIVVNPGPQFRFGAARMAPYADGTALPRDFRDTLPARSTAIGEAAVAGVEGWRNLGHAKASVAGQSVVADHAARTLDVAIRLNPGPRLRFGTLSIEGAERMRVNRIRKIADLPEGEVFSPEELDDAALRLRRSGVFRSVTMTEADVPNADGTLDIALTVAEEVPRRFGFGAEITSSDGLDISGYWLHRNLFGGGERLRIDGSIEEITGEWDESAYRLSARLDRPATFSSATSAFLAGEVGRYSLADLRLNDLSLGFGVSHAFSDELTVETGIAYEVVDASIEDLSVSYRQVAFPSRVEWDKRDDRLNATSGFYLAADVTPFVGFETSGSGAQVKTDARYYHGFGAGNRVVLAGRAQVGSVIGPTLDETPPDYLFLSGGGGTVRGQPFESLGVSRTIDSITFESGGQSFAALSGEVRGRITEAVSLVGFFDAGFVGADGDFGDGRWHSGAGLGVRYDTGIGPIRLDLATPVSGDTGDGVQLYIGIGQAF